jgi:hypothetical protein
VALSYNDFNSVGITVCNLSWSFLLRAHVKVYKSRDRLADTGTLLAETTDYTWTGASQITLVTAIASGEVVTIERQTPNNAQLSPWTDGSNLTAEALNNADLQNLYVIQEQEDSNDLGAAKAIAATTASNTATSTANTAKTTADAAKLATDTYVHDGTSVKGDGVGSNPQGLAYGITTADNAKTAADAAKLATDTYVHDGTSLKGDGVGSNPQGVKYAVDQAAAAKTATDTYVHDGTSLKGDGIGGNPQGVAYAVTTSSTASTNASSAVTTANNADTNATTALNNSRESDGAGGYTTAITKAGTAKTTADAAKLASDRLVATTSDNGSTWTLTGNNTNASTDPKGVGYAVTTAETAQTTANSASATATSAQNAVAAAVLYSPVTNVSSIPGSPSDDDYIEIADSTGIESFTPLASLPAGFTGDTGLTVRLKYTTSGTTWNYLSYFANDSEDRYKPVYGKHVPTQTTYIVKVVTKTSAHRDHGSGSSDGYTIGGIEAPHLDLIPGNTYRFDQSDSSNSGHPIGFYKKRDKTGGAYTTGVTSTGTAGSSGAYTDITISDDTHSFLFYQCPNHGYMGGSIHANNAAGESDRIEEDNTSVVVNDNGAGSSCVVTLDGSEIGVYRPHGLHVNNILTCGMSWAPHTGINLGLRGNSYTSNIAIADFTSAQTSVNAADVKYGKLRFTHNNIFSMNDEGAAIVEGCSAGAYTSTSKPSGLKFYTTPSSATAPVERLRVYKDGQIGIGGANYGTSGQVLTSAGNAAAPSWSDPAGGGATGGGTDKIFVENSLVVTTDYTIGDNGTTNKSAHSVGPITINSGKTVTVPSGHRWVII